MSDDNGSLAPSGPVPAVLRLPAESAARLTHLFRRQPVGHPLLPVLRLYRSRPEPASAAPSEEAC